MASPKLLVVGRFPPPLDGQAIGTALLADLLSPTHRGPFEVERVNVGKPDGDTLDAATGRFQMQRAWHFLQRRASVRAAASGDPDLVLWPSISPSLLGHARDLAVVASAFSKDQPLVGVVHRGDFATLFTSPLTRPTARWLVRRLAGLVFLSDGLAARCAPWVPPGKRLVVPNTVDPALVPSPGTVREAQRIRESRTGLRLLYLSGMIPSKGYLDVLGGLALLRRQGVPASATFIGRWPDSNAEGSFRARASELGVSDAVTVPGGVSDRSVIQQYYLDADLFVLPTSYPIEAQPLTVIEAFSAGTPVIVTRHASLPEMMSGGVEGEFVPAGDPAAIARAALQIAPSWRSYSDAARARFDEAFSPSAVQARWVDTLRPLLRT